MGSQELLLYPIKDSIIRSIDWDASTVTAISKKNIIKALNVSEHLFTEALLMTGTSFLPPFPALLEPTLIKVQPFTISDAVNMLRTSDKSVTIACTSSFNDIVKLKDPNWLDKYQKACMAISHFIYIAENGEVQVNDYDHLTGDNHEYLGLQLPSELFHYLNTGLIGPRMLGWITHGQLMVLPTADGVASDEYKKLVSSQLVPIKEMTLGLLIPRLHRGIQHKSITMKVWYDRNYSYTVNHRNLQPSFIRIAGWDVKEGAIKEHFPKFAAGSIASEVLALKNLDFAKATVTKEKVKGLQSGDAIVSLTIWRLLQLRGYVNDGHTLTDWGNALATSMSAFEPTVKQHPEVPHLYEAILVAFELLRFELLNARNKHEELRGLALNGTEDDQASLLLISRCSTLLKLRHEANGYTGPLSKNLLAFRSLVSEVRSADRDLTEALIASMFMYAQAKRDRDDGWQISHRYATFSVFYFIFCFVLVLFIPPSLLSPKLHGMLTQLPRLPFLSDPDVALGIAVKTYLDEISPSDTPEQKNLRKQQFPSTYLPYALRFSEDLDICCAFFDAIHAGVKALGTKEIPASDMAAWDKAAKYLELRR